MRYRFCTCNSASEEPCPYCQDMYDFDGEPPEDEDFDEPEPEEYGPADPRGDGPYNYQPPREP